MAPRPGSELIQGATDLLVLSVLADGPQYGYALAKQVAARSGGAVKLAPGVLYPLLHGLERQGLLHSSWENVQAEGNAGRGRKRKWYRLSAKGRRRLAQRVKAHRAYQAMVERFLGKEGAG